MRPPSETGAAERGGAAEAAGEPRPVRTLDVRGLACPVPVARTAQAASAMSPGEVLEVLATDPDAELDVRAWAVRSGDEVVSTRWVDGYLRLLVRRS